MKRFAVVGSVLAAVCLLVLVGNYLDEGKNKNQIRLEASFVAVTPPAKRAEIAPAPPPRVIWPPAAPAAPAPPPVNQPAPQVAPMVDPRVAELKGQLKELGDQLAELTAIGKRREAELIRACTLPAAPGTDGPTAAVPSGPTGVIGGYDYGRVKRAKVPPFKPTP